MVRWESLTPGLSAAEGDGVESVTYSAGHVCTVATRPLVSPHALPGTSAPG